MTFGTSLVSALKNTANAAGFPWLSFGFHPTNRHSSIASFIPTYRREITPTRQQSITSWVFRLGSSSLESHLAGDEVIKLIRCLRFTHRGAAKDAFRMLSTFKSTQRNIPDNFNLKELSPSVVFFTKHNLYCASFTAMKLNTCLSEQCV
jgi:hypothetical protein